MGGNKALLDLGGRTALARVASLRLPQPCRSVVVVGAEAEAVRVEAASAGLEVVTNAAFDEGQTGSLQCGLRALAGCEAFLLHPVDLPLITQDDYDRVLAAHLEGARPDAITVASFAMRRGHPVIFGAVVAERLLALGPDEPARAVLSDPSSPLRHVVVENPWVLRDLDTPADLAAARDALRRR